VRAAEPLRELARAVLDGVNVDWNTAESHAAPSERALIRELRVLHGLAAVLRTEPTGERQPAAPSGEWGPLVVLDRIGAGACGVVYRAWDRRLDREVALKLLGDPRAAGDPDGSIIEEGRRLARVNHPNVVTVYGADRIDGRVGLWMELIRGDTLEQLLERGEVFTVRDAVAIGLDLCGAVAAVHAARLLHRDIKPQNVMRAADGRVVLMDLGTGRDYDDPSAWDLAGTPLYLAPEVLRGEPATARSDVYSLGVLLFRLLSGTYPVAGRTVDELRAIHDERSPGRGLKAARPDIPSSLASAVERATSRNPHVRHPTAEALAADLKSVLPAPRLVTLRAALATGAAAAILATVLAFHRSGEPPPAPARAVGPFEDSGAIGLSRQLRVDSYRPDHDAWELYVKAAQIHDVRNAQNALDAASQFRAVVTKDPLYAKAWARLAIALAAAHRLREGDIATPLPAQMEHAARTAVELDPDLPEAHVALGTLFALARDWTKAEQAFVKALEMDSSFTSTHTEFVLTVLMPLGRLDRAMAQLTTAESRNPMSLDVQRVKAHVQVEMGAFGAAIETSRAILERDPKFPYAALWLGRAYALSGRHDAALRIFEGEPRYWGYLGYTYAVMGRHEDARRVLDANPDAPAQRMLIFAGLGEREHAYGELARLAVRNPWRAATWVRRPEMAVLRGDPRVENLKKNVLNLPAD
jgi:serine/threonine-protein kinase